MNFVSNPESQLAPREWRRHMLHPLTLTALAAASAVLGLVGPLATIDSLSFPFRSMYWTLLTFLAYALGNVISVSLLRKSLRDWGICGA
jgi:hypothetical protein